MTRTSRLIAFTSFVAFTLVVLLPPVAFAQAPQEARASQLGAGWHALASGRAAEAAAIADRLLQGRPGDHDGVSLAIAARAAAGALAALDTYERWLTVRQHEDRFLLQPIALAMLRELAGHKEPRVRYGALAALAASGDAEAQRTLNEASSQAELPIEAERAMAQAGMPEGIARLEARLAKTDGRDQSAAIAALAAQEARGALAPIIAALKHPAPPTRMAAADALGRLGEPSAIEPLKAALGDAHLPVRVVATAALARLGDQAALEAVKKYETSPVGELRLLAARVAASAAGDESWVATTEPLLQDPDPMVRLAAAELLLDHGRSTGAATAAIELALNDPSPGLRALAGEKAPLVANARAAGEDLATLRRLLRDKLPDLRLAAAKGVLWPASPR